jgi:hypothetical protein
MSEILYYFALIIFCLLVIRVVSGLFRRRSVLQNRLPSVESHPHSLSRLTTGKQIPAPHENVSRVQANQELLTTLTAVPAMLVNLLRYRAIDLYRSQYGVSWQEAARAVEQLGCASGEEDRTASISFPQGADPLVTALLLQSGCRDDALVYFSQSSGTTSEEAEEAINFMQMMVDEHSWPSLRERLLDDAAPDPASLQFLLCTGNRSLAIQYYRERTNTNWLDAYKVVEEMSKQTSGQMHDS